MESTLLLAFKQRVVCVMCCAAPPGGTEGPAVFGAVLETDGQCEYYIIGACVLPHLEQRSVFVLYMLRTCRLSTSWDQVSLSLIYSGA